MCSHSPAVLPRFIAAVLVCLNLDKCSFTFISSINLNLRNRLQPTLTEDDCGGSGLCNQPARNSKQEQLVLHFSILPICGSQRKEIMMHHYIFNNNHMAGISNTITSQSVKTVSATEKKTILSCITNYIQNCHWICLACSLTSNHSWWWQKDDTERDADICGT